ncbi:response regulator [Pseudomonas sp. HLT2-19-2]
MNKTIIIVDDHPIVCSAIKAMLERNGYDVLAESADGIDALSKIRTLTPEYLLLDIGIDGLDGLSVLQRINAEQLNGLQRQRRRRARLPQGRDERLPAQTRQPTPLLAQHTPALATAGPSVSYMGDIPDSTRQVIMAELVISNCEDLQTLQACLTAFDLEGVASIAHKLKGSARLMQ